MKKLAVVVLSALLTAALLWGASTAFGDFIAIPRGTGAGETGRVRFRELAANGQNSVDFKAPDSLAATTTYTLPNALPASNDLKFTCTTAGVCSWATDQTGGGGGGLAYVETATVSGGAALVFDTCVSSTYDYYRVLVNLTTANDGVGMGIQFSTDGGMTFDTGTNYESAIAQATSGGAGTSGGTGLTNLSMNNVISNVAGYSFSATIDLENVNQTTLFRTASGITSSRVSSGDARWFIMSFTGRWTNTSTVYNAFRIIAGSGNVTGTGYCYGYAKS